MIVADAYPPMRTSCAVQMYDLGQALIKAGHQVTMIFPVVAQTEKVRIQMQDGVRLVQVHALQTKDVNYVQRFFAELINPFLMWHHLKRQAKFTDMHVNGLIWYSPTIFWGPLIKRLKRHFRVPAYLILRDIFPDWAIDLGVIKKGPIYLFLKLVEAHQYRQANTIGVQSPNNLEYFIQRHPQLKNKTQVLWNWAGKLDIKKPCSINLATSSLAGRAICIYAGNMGVAQGVEVLFSLAASLKHETNLGFVFVGRGSETASLRARMHAENLTNVLLFDEINHDEIPSLYVQCDIGLLSLDLRHRTHNIPGKLITYLHSGLPVFGLVNPGNDLLDMTQEVKIGFVTDNPDLMVLKEQLERLVQQMECDTEIHNRCQAEACRLFSVNVVQKQIVNTLIAVF
jgi:glycosyltransferase involved in cell wall biosynthesis